MSLRDPLVSGEFLAHLAHLFCKLLFVFVISSVSHSNLYFAKQIVFNDIFLTYFCHKGSFINLLSHMMDEYIYTCP